MAACSDDRSAIEPAEDAGESGVGLRPKMGIGEQEGQRVVGKAVASVQRESPAGLCVDDTESRHGVAGSTGEPGCALRRLAAEKAGPGSRAPALPAEDPQKRRPHSLDGSVDGVTVLVDEGKLDFRRDRRGGEDLRLTRANP